MKNVEELKQENERLKAELAAKKEKNKQEAKHAEQRKKEEAKEEKKHAKEEKMRAKALKENEALRQKMAEMERPRTEGDPYFSRPFNFRHVEHGTAKDNAKSERREGVLPPPPPLPVSPARLSLPQNATDSANKPPMPKAPPRPPITSPGIIPQSTGKPGATPGFPVVQVAPGVAKPTVIARPLEVPARSAAATTAPVPASKPVTTTAAPAARKLPPIPVVINPVAVHFAEEPKARPFSDIPAPSPKAEKVERKRADTLPDLGVNHRALPERPAKPAAAFGHRHAPVAPVMPLGKANKRDKMVDPLTITNPSNDPLRNLAGEAGRILSGKLQQQHDPLAKAFENLSARGLQGTSTDDIQKILDISLLSNGSAGLEVRNWASVTVGRFLTAYRADLEKELTSRQVRQEHPLINNRGGDSRAL